MYICNITKNQGLSKRGIKRLHCFLNNMLCWWRIGAKCWAILFNVYSISTTLFKIVFINLGQFFAMLSLVGPTLFLIMLESASKHHEKQSWTILLTAMNHKRCSCPGANQISSDRRGADFLMECISALPRRWSDFVHLVPLLLLMI